MQRGLHFQYISVCLAIFYQLTRADPWICWSLSRFIEEVPFPYVYFHPKMDYR